MRVSKYIKPHKDILIEYIYDDGNNISEAYKILQNLRDNSLSYVAGNGSITNNSQPNQLVQLDPVTNNYGLLNTTNYSFLQLKDYASGFPTRHDYIKVHLPVNYTFGEYLGFYIKVYTFDFNNRRTYTLSNFYFDISNIDQEVLLGFNAPAFLFQEKLWGKNVTIHFPSVYDVSRQRVGTGAKNNSLNANLTNGFGLSQTAPVFIDFHFITQKRTVNSVTTFNLTPKTALSLPQAPDFENLGVKIDHSNSGDFFEIYGTFNGDVNQFDNFIQNSFIAGSRYYVTFTMTLFEQNIRGKSFTITLTDNFNEKVEYRPIIKFSTTTAIIDVEMNLIDAVDNSSIYRKASYGMLQDEVAKYSLNMTKINLANASKPKIYNIKSPEGAGIFGNGRKRGNQMSNGVVNSGGLSAPISQVYLDPIKVNYAVLTNMFSVIAKSDNVVVGRNTFYGLGKLEIVLQSFDNVVQFRIAQDVTQLTLAPSLRAPSQISAAPKYMDLTNMGEIKLVIKNEKLYFESNLFFGSNEVDLANGVVVFKIPQNRMADVRKIYDTGNNIFYITSSNETGSIVIYSGIYMIFDTRDNIENLRNQARAAQSAAQNETQQIIPDPETRARNENIATVTVAQGTPTSLGTGGTSSNTSTATSVESVNRIGGKTYKIDTNSGLTINGFGWSTGNIQEALGLDKRPTQLSFKSDGLYSFNKFLDKLAPLEDKLKAKFIKTPEQKEVLESTQRNFVDN